MSEAPPAHTEAAPLMQRYASRYSSINRTSMATMAGGDGSVDDDMNMNMNMNISDSEKQMIKQLGEIWVMCEAMRQMQRLSWMHYYYRHVRFNIVPLTMITMASGIMAFLASADLVPGKIKNYLSLSVGILSIFSAAIQSANQEARYDSKAEMHKNAAIGLEKITDSINFIQVDPNSLKDLKNTISGGAIVSGGGGETSLPFGVQQSEHEHNIDEAKTNGVGVGVGVGAGVLPPPPPMKIPNSNDSTNANSLEHSCSTFLQVYQQILDSCQSPIPVKISQTFKMAEFRLEMTLRKEDKEVIKKEYGYLGKQIIHKCLYNEVFCRITDYPGFPWISPSPDKVVTESMKKVENYFQERQVTFERKEEV